MIQFDNVRKTYNGTILPVHAIQEVDLRIEEGEFVAVMGPSGSGKSTLLTILGAMNPPTEGWLTIDGIDVYALSVERQADFRREYVGFVFQQLQLLPYLTALENVLLALTIARMPRSEKLSRAWAALEKVGLAGKGDRLPSQLSGGEQGRVAVARAVVLDPPLLLADEPTGSLDSATSRQVLELLHGLNSTGQTVVMVTHDLQAAAYASRIVHILDGRIVSDSLPVEAPGQVGCHAETLEMAASAIP